MMSWVDALTHRLRTILDPGAHAREIEEEMRFHLELDEMQQRDAGQARRRFGNRSYYKEETRAMTWLAALDTPRQDLAYVWRTLAGAPSFTIMVVVTLALGIGLNSATFSLLDRLMLRPPGGVEAPASLRRIWIERFRTFDGPPFTSQSINYPMFRAIARAAGDSASMALFTTEDDLRLGRTHTAPKVRGVYASADYFGVLGAHPAFGRFFLPDEDRLGHGASVVVVSHAFWRNQLAGDTAAVGRTIAVGRDAYTVVGVADPRFTGLDLQPIDVWIPLASMPAPSWASGPWWESTNNYAFRAIQRVAPGGAEREFERRATALVRIADRAANAERADTLMQVFTGSIIEAGWGPGKPGQEVVIATRLGGVAVIVLLIALANVTNLLLARAVHRRREIAVRLALGIARWRLVRLLVMETLVLASIAAIAAVLVGWWGGTLLRSLLLPDIQWGEPALHWRVVLFTVAVALLAGLIAGIVPAVQASNPQLAAALKAGSRDGVRHKSRLRGGLVVAQAALSVMLLVGAALFVRSLHNVQGVDIGFDATRLVFGRVDFDEGAAPPSAVVGATLRDVAARLATRPGVEAVARTLMEPMRGFSTLTFSGGDSTGSFREHMPTMAAVTPGFFKTTGMRIVRGTDFTGGDGAGAPAEVIVNEAMAKRLWPGRDALGLCMRFRSVGDPCYVVVGIVANARQLHVIEKAPASQYYLPLGSMPVKGWIGSTIIVRAQPNATKAAAAELQSALRQAFPGADGTATPMTANLEPQYRPWHVGARLFTAFGLLALLVALIGIYSTVSYAVSQRTHEFGVRIALGARVVDVLRHVLGEGLRTVAVGVLLGVALAAAAARLIASLLYGVEPTDPAILPGVAATVLAVSALAALSPAWRAARVDPTTALRAD